MVLGAAMAEKIPGGSHELKAAPASALIVESDANSAGVICGSLENLGFNVKRVATGVEAVIAARQVPPTLIFLSVQLGDVAGDELVTWLRANPSLTTVPIIAIHSSAEDEPDLRDGIFQAHLRMPTSAEKVDEIVRDICLRDA